MMPFQSIKLVLVGTNGVGKTSLLISYTTDRFPHDYIPTVFDSWAESFQDPSGRNPHITYSLGLWDTACHAEYDRLRPLSYPQTDIFMLCFDVCNASTYEEIRTKWYPEVQHHCPEALIVVAGTKIDQRQDREDSNGQIKRAKRSLTLEQGVALANEIGAQGYFECSALTGEGVKDLFAGTVRIVIDGLVRPSRKAGKVLRCIVA